MAQSTKCLILLAVIALFFITEIIPLAVTAMAGSIACGLLGFIPAKQVFSGLSNSTVVLFAGMFVVGAAMFYTGLAQKIGETVVRFTGTGENSLMVGVMLVGAGLSSVLSNTGTAACLLPVVLGVCAAAKIPASTELMPLAFACGLGGIITLVGTPPNIIASGALEQAGYRAFGFFEFAKIGIPLTLAGLVYMMFIGKHLLPKRELDANQEIEQEVEATSTSSSKMAVSGIILLVVVLVMALGIKGITLEMAAITGAIVAVLTGCLTEKQAYASIDWVTIFLFAGMMPVSSAMSKTGAGKVAVLMAIAVAASCAFATPVGTPPNTLVLGPGKFTFMDYVKCGTGLVLVCFVISLILIPMFWPFFPGK